MSKLRDDLAAAEDRAQELYALTKDYQKVIMALVGTPPTRPNYREHTCGECRYHRESGNTHSKKCVIDSKERACPDFVPREVPS